MLRKIISAIALVFGITGCSGVPMGPGVDDPKALPSVAVLNLHGDTDFTPEERFGIQKAQDTWSLQTAGQARINITYDLDFNKEDVLDRVTKEEWYTLVRVDENSEYAAAHPGILGNATSGGIHSGFRVSITLFVERIDAMYGPAGLHQVAVHELGHGLGLQHLEDPNAIMFPVLRPASNVCLKKPDLTEFCRMNSCNGPTYPCQ